MLIFIESHERINRADCHARTFVNAYLRFLHAEPYGITHEMRDERNGVIKLVPQKTLDRELPLVLGEFFYQLRASLDAAMWKAYELLGGSSVKENRLEFPIFEVGKSRSFKDATFHNVPLPSQLRSWLDAIQPCHADRLANKSDESRISRALGLINECARKDRHRQLHIVGTVVSCSTALVKFSPPARVTYLQDIPADLFQGQYEIAIFGVEGMTAGTEIEVDWRFTIHVAVKEIPDDVDLMVRVYQLKDAASEAIQKFEEAFR